LLRAADPKAPHLVAVEQSGITQREDDRSGWSAAGERVSGLTSGRRQGRIKLIAIEQRN